MKNDYIVTRYNEEYGYCLKFICGADRANAERVLKECQEKEPDQQFRIEEIEEKDCWWNQGWLD